MFDKLFQAQQKAEEIKKRLDTISVYGEAEGGLIRVTATANKEIKSVSINPTFHQEADLEELEELLAVAINKAIQQAEQISQSEMQASAKDLMGGFGNLFGG